MDLIESNRPARSPRPPLHSVPLTRPADLVHTSFRQRPGLLTQLNCDCADNRRWIHRRSSVTAGGKHVNPKRHLKRFIDEINVNLEIAIVLNAKLNRSVSEVAMAAAKRVVTLVIEAVRVAIPSRTKSVKGQKIPVTNQASKPQSGAIYFK